MSEETEGKGIRGHKVVYSDSEELTVERVMKQK